MQRAEIALIAHVPLHCLRCGNGERPDRGVVDVDEAARDGKELAESGLVHATIIGVTRRASLRNIDAEVWLDPRHELP